MCTWLAAAPETPRSQQAGHWHAPPVCDLLRGEGPAGPSSACAAHVRDVGNRKRQDSAPRRGTKGHAGQEEPQHVALTPRKL